MKCLNKCVYYYLFFINKYKNNKFKLFMKIKIMNNCCTERQKSSDGPRNSIKFSTKSTTKKSKNL